jgi:hypothetical protein
MLWDMLTLICFLMPVAGAVSAAKQAHVGYVGHVTAVLAGIVVAFAFCWSMRRAGESVGRRYAAGTTLDKEWPFRALYLSALCWAFLALFCGGWAASSLLKIVR